MMRKRWSTTLGLRTSSMNYSTTSLRQKRRAAISQSSCRKCASSGSE